MPIFDERTTGRLRTPLQEDDPRGKTDRDNNPYFPGHEIIDTLNQIFGYDGWACSVKELMMMSERVVEKTDRKKKDGDGRPLKYRLHELQYNAIVRLEVYGLADSSKRSMVFREDVGNQIAYCSDLLPPPHSLAAKGAVTSGLKRAARTLGAQFGLTLYRDDPFGDQPLYYEEQATTPERTAPPPPPASKERDEQSYPPARPQENAGGDPGGGAESAAPAAEAVSDAAQLPASDAPPSASPSSPNAGELTRDETPAAEAQPTATGPTADDVADRIREFKKKRERYPGVVERRKLNASALKALNTTELQAIMDDIQREESAR